MRTVVTAEVENAAIRCFRCGEDLLRVEDVSGSAGEPSWVTVDGLRCCADFHGHDEYGLYAPVHSPEPDGDATVTADWDCPNFDAELASASGVG